MYYSCNTRLSCIFIIFLFIAVLFTGSVPASVETQRLVPVIPNLTLVKDEIVVYHNSGQWESDIAAEIARAKQYIEERLASDCEIAIVLDIDETALSNWSYLKKYDFGIFDSGTKEWANSKKTPIIPTLNLYRFARDKEIAVFFITGREEKLRTITEKDLRNAGYDKWDGIFMKPNDYNKVSIVPFKAGARKSIAEKNYCIVANIGDQKSDLAGGYAEKTFKLPNPMYYNP